MYLESPQLLLLLWLLPVVGGLLVYAQRRRATAAHRFAGDVMLPRLMPAIARGRIWTKGVVLLVGLGLLTFAAARPRWGVYFEDVQARGVDMFVLLDVSRSMLAEDVAPNRLERAKSDIRDLLQYLQGDRVGLIAFAGAAVVQSPLTTDQGFFQLVLDETDPDSAPRGGSLIGDAIRKALESMEPRHDRDQVIVLITDGEDHDSYPAEAAQAAAQRGVKVICVGLGDTEEGMRIPIRDETGSLTYMKHDGQEVWSKMDEALLREIALTTEGAYIPAKTRAYDLGQVYSQHLAGLTRGEISADKRKRYRERFQWFVVLGLAALLVEMVIARSPTGSPRWNQRLSS
ncbi:MAG: VWA domain-containing protein [Planctomycetota bacterium]|nr:VWA domain-containing protein [Planctomycetota bacterium]